MLDFHSSCFSNLSHSFSDGRVLQTVCEHSGDRHLMRTMRIVVYPNIVRLVQITVLFFFHDHLSHLAIDA